MSVVPYPAVTVFIDLGEGLTVDDASGHRERGSVVAGLAPGPVFRGRGKSIECLQVRLSPVVARSVLAASSELSGTVASFADLWGRDAARTQERLKAATSWQHRFELAAAAIARRVEAGRAADPEVTFAWRQMLRSRGQVRVADLAAKAGWSRKRLWSRFGSQIGLTPKRAAQLIRFDHAAHRLAAGHDAAMVAFECGYADQSHLHRDVASFAGTTPAALATAPWLNVDPVAWASPEYLDGAG